MDYDSSIKLVVDAEMKDLLRLGVMHESQIRGALTRVACVDWPLEGRGPYIRTYTKRQFYPFCPDINDIVIEDIVHALSNICRFGGHVDPFYSVAQHSYCVSLLLERYSLTYALRGLLHDASEAYMGDIVRPIKRSPWFRPYLRYEAALQNMIYEAFDLLPDSDEGMSKTVKWADDTMLATELRDVMCSHAQDWEKLPAALVPCITDGPWSSMKAPWSPAIARNMFMDRFHFLTEQIKLERYRGQDE